MPKTPSVGDVGDFCFLRNDPAEIPAFVRALLDGARDAANRWIFRDLGLEPWRAKRMLISGSNRARHGVDVTVNTPPVAQYSNVAMVTGSNFGLVTTNTVNTPGDRFIELESYGRKPVCIVGQSCFFAVYDKETGLVWESAPSTTRFQWVNALAHCRGTAAGNRRGWRLPSLEELTSLVDGATFPPAGHPFQGIGGASDTYWSASTFEDNAAVAYAIDPADPNFLFGEFKNSVSARAWCVRGGSGVSNPPY